MLSDIYERPLIKFFKLFNNIIYPCVMLRNIHSDIEKASAHFAHSNLYSLCVYIDV